MRLTALKLPYLLSDWSRSPNPFSAGRPILDGLIKLSDRERKFLQSHDVCRFATASKEAVPHVVPVVYALDGDAFVVAIDYGTKKLKNLRENPVVSLVVDDYDPNRAVFVQGKCRMFERGKEYLRLLKILFDRFEFYRNTPWGEGESPILVVTPDNATSWGLS